MSESREEKHRSLAVSRDAISSLLTIANRPSCSGVGQNAHRTEFFMGGTGGFSTTKLRNRHGCKFPCSSRNSDWSLHVRVGVLQDFRAAGGRRPVSLQPLQAAVGERLLDSDVRAA